MFRSIYSITFLAFYPSVDRLIYLSSTYLSIKTSTYLPLFLFIYSTIPLRLFNKVVVKQEKIRKVDPYAFYIHLSVSIHIFLSSYQSTYLSIYLPVYLSIYLLLRIFTKVVVKLVKIRNSCCLFSGNNRNILRNLKSKEG